jgi:AcrR family transcriptional regulator
MPDRSRQECSIATTAIPLNRDRIVDAAYRAWGANLFSATSLNLVARELGVTKTALYRHFRGKEDLLNAMEADFVSQMVASVVTPLTEEIRSAGADDRLEVTIAGYFRSILAFFEDRPYRFVFFMRHLFGRDRADGAVGELQRRHDVLLLEMIRGRSEMVARFVATTAIFWTTRHQREAIIRSRLEDEPFRPAEEALSPETVERLVAEGARLVVGGFVPDPWKIDREMVERIAWIQPEELPARHHVMDAITETVLEVGYAAATVERIAARAGLSKSGLYHYFSNRDDMLCRTIVETQSHFAGLARLRFAQLGTHTERLYALFVMLAGYAHHDPSSMVVENWLRESNIEVQIPASHIVEIRRIYAFISEMVGEGQLVGSRDDGFAILTFISYLVMQELTVGKARLLSRDRLLARMWALFQLFSGGIGSTTGTHGENQ